MASEIRASVLSALSAGPLDGDGLLKKIPEIEDKKQLANLMYNLRKAGLVDKGDDGLYRTKGGARRARTEKPERAALPVAQKRRGRRPGATPADPAPVNARSIMEKLLSDSQGALDEYLSSIGDPKILGPLVIARDAARDALRACGGDGGCDD